MGVTGLYKNVQLNHSIKCVSFFSSIKKRTSFHSVTTLFDTMLPQDYVHEQKYQNKYEIVILNSVYIHVLYVESRENLIQTLEH